MPLASNETVLAHPERVGDRWLFSVLEYAGDPSYPPAAGLEHAIVDMRTVSVDSCGEDPRTVVEGAAWPIRHSEVTEDDESPAVWLACSMHTGELWWFDPTGESPAISLGLTGGTRVLQENGPGSFESFHRCDSVLIIDDSVVVQRPDQGAGPWIERIDLDEGLGAERLANGTFVDAYWDGGTPEVFVMDEALGLLAVDTDTGESEVLAEPGVSDPTVEDGRYVTWRPASGANETVIVDRETGEQIEVADPPRAQAPDGSPDFLVTWRGDGVWALNTTSSSVLVWLETMQSQSLDTSGWAYVGRTEGRGVVLGRESGSRHSYYVVDGPGQEPRPLIVDVGKEVWLRPDALIVPKDPPLLYGADASPPLSDSLIDYLLVPLDGSPPTTLVRDVFIPLALTNDRWAAVQGYANDGVGDLLMLDPDGGSLGRIDTDVYPYLSLFAGQGVDPHDPTDSILYQVRDPAGERTGIWFAQVL